MVLLLAIKDQASDIHFEPFEDEFKIRVRADGVLYEMVPPPRHLANAITTRIKVMAELDIAERRLPQDGRIELNVGGNSVDLRVSVLPTMFGESVVMRVLDRTVVQLDLNKIGMDATIAAPLPPDHSQPQRHRAGDGSDRQRQDDHALFGAQRAQRNLDQGHHDRRPDRIRNRRADSGSGQSRHRSHVRQRAARDSAARSGHDSRRRNPRLRNGGNRHSKCADRAPGLQHAAHQRRADGHHAAARHGRAAVLDHGHARSDSCPAAGAEDLHRMPDRVRAQRRTADGAAAADRPGPAIQLLLRQGLSPGATTRATRAAPEFTNCWKSPTTFAT